MVSSKKGANNTQPTVPQTSSTPATPSSQPVVSSDDSNWKQFCDASRPLWRSKPGDWMHNHIIRRSLRRFLCMTVVASQVSVVLGMAKEARHDLTTDPFDFARNMGEFFQDPKGNIDEFASLYREYITDPDNFWLPLINESFGESVNRAEVVHGEILSALGKSSRDVDFANDIFDSFMSMDMSRYNFEDAHEASDHLVSSLNLEDEQPQQVYFRLIQPTCELPIRLNNSAEASRSRGSEEYLWVSSQLLSGLSNVLDNCDYTELILEKRNIMQHDSFYFNEDGIILVSFGGSDSWRYKILGQPNVDGSYTFRPAYLIDNGTNYNSLLLHDEIVDIDNPELTEVLKNVQTYLQLRTEYNEYKDTGEASENLHNVIRTDLINSINDSFQFVVRPGSGTANRERFITPRMSEIIADSFLRFAEIFNIDILDLSRALKNRALDIPITYYVGGGEEGNIINLHGINVYGENDSRLTYVLVHEFMHAIFSDTFAYSYVPTYREAFAELSTIIATSEFEDLDFSAYPESTLLLAASGIMHDIVRRTNSPDAKPQTLDEIFGSGPSLHELAQRFGDINDDAVQEMIIYPQTDERTLLKSDDPRRPQDSIDLLRRLLTASGIDWADYKDTLINFIVTSCIPDDIEDQDRVRRKLLRLWRNE